MNLNVLIGMFIEFCVIITRGKNCVVKKYPMAIGFIPVGSESLRILFLWALSCLCRLCSLDMRSFVDRHKPGIPTGMLLSVMVIECCVFLFI